jgi:ACS family hexuronate transporter-like MFS transporter
MAKKWQVCILLFLATTLNYLDRQTISILAPQLQREMHINNAALGSIFAIFYYAYTFAQVGSGLILDRAHLRWIYGCAVLGWSIVSSFTGFSTGLLTLMLFRFGLGITESANWPGALRIVARMLKPEERALGNGIFTSGTSIGALIAPAIILPVSFYFGWRWTFAVVGSLGLLWFIAWVWGHARRKPAACLA